MKSWRLPVLFALLLGGATAALYWPATGYDFVTFDDPDFVEFNPMVREGLTPGAILRAFTENAHLSYLWMPATTLSLMADRSLWGLGPRGFHLTNIVLFSLSVTLLPLVLWRATRRWGPGLFAAALFAFHPLRVESVAWATARKDCLLLLFLLLAIAAYLRWIETGRERWRSAVMAFFIVGLLSKPTMVLLPLLLLLLDHWPLGRLAGPGSLPGRLRPLVMEKLPLLAVSGAFAAITLFVQRGNIGLFPLPPLANLRMAVSSPFIYLGKTVWPSGLHLATFSPSEVPSWWAAAAAGALLIAITWAALRQSRQRPFLLAGWLWYLASLLLNSGIIPNGTQWLADRFTLLPHIGLAMAFAWGGAELLRGRETPFRRATALLLALLLLAPLAAASRHQLAFWRDSEALWRRAISVSPGNAGSRSDLAAVLGERGDFGGAIAELARALRLDPDSRDANFNMALALELAGRREEAATYYRRTLAIDPNDGEARAKLEALR